MHLKRSTLGGSNRAHSTMRFFLAPILLLSSGCAPKLRLPAVAPNPAWSAVSTWRPPATFHTAPYSTLRQDHDATGQLTRLTVTTHRGIYTGWVQKPQISFYIQFTGPQPRTTPSVVALLFRTLEPEAVTSNRLVLDCDGTSDTVAVIPRSELEQGSTVHSHYLTYLLPIEAVGTFAACTEGTLSVGQLRSRFSTNHLAALQALLRAAVAKPGAT